MSNDKELKNYLQGESGLSKLYHELPQVGLPDHLDAAILAEAHRAVGSHPGGKRKRRWTFPLSMVATLFVAVMIALQLPYILKDAELTQAPVEKRAAVASMAETMPEPGLEKNRAERVSAASADSSDAGLSQEKKSRVVSRERQVMAAKPEVHLFAASKKPATISGLALSPVAPGVHSMPEAGAKPQAASPAPVLAAKRLRESAEAERDISLLQEKQAVAQAQNFVSDSLDRRAPAAPVSAENALVKSSADEAIANKPDEAKPRPEKWLARIKRLKQQGKMEDAAKELAAFKKRYPDYPVPAAYEIK